MRSWAASSWRTDMPDLFEMAQGAFVGIIGEILNGSRITSIVGNQLVSFEDEAG